MTPFETGADYGTGHVTALPAFDLRAYHDHHHRMGHAPLPFSTCEFCLGVRSATE